MPRLSPDLQCADRTAGRRVDLLIRRPLIKADDRAAVVHRKITMARKQQLWTRLRGRQKPLTPLQPRRMLMKVRILIPGHKVDDVAYRCEKCGGQVMRSVPRAW
jgi:hypothetical protein